MAMSKSKKQNCVFSVGYWVALSISDGIAPLRCYVGKIQAIDSHGVRITLVDWVTGSDAGWDLFVAWGDIKASLVATPEHDNENFLHSSAQWQESIQKNAAKPLK